MMAGIPEKAEQCFVIQIRIASQTGDSPTIVLVYSTQYDADLDGGSVTQTLITMVPQTSRITAMVCSIEQQILKRWKG